MPRCNWCQIVELTDPRASFCCRKCRQAAWRFRKRCRLAERDGRRLRVAYADPPYPGCALRYYGDQPDYAGEVNHLELLERLQRDYDGWALSTSARALRDLLPLCPPDIRVCPWVKPLGVSRLAKGPNGNWEPVLVMPARLVQPATRDWLLAHPARGGGSLPGRKPQRFWAWLFGLLGIAVGDGFDDLFPGTGLGTSCWTYANTLELRPSVSPEYSSDGPLPGDGDDVSLGAGADG